MRGGGCDELVAGYWFLVAGYWSPSQVGKKPPLLMSYRNLEIWQLARTVSISVHRMTLAALPKFEMYEKGSQIRRSAKSIRSNIVEGYGRRRYPADYLKHLTYAQGSCDDTIDHLETLHETESLRDAKLFHEIAVILQTLGKKLNLFIQSIERAQVRRIARPTEKSSQQQSQPATRNQ
jgi:four helix bundle protein